MWNVFLYRSLNEILGYDKCLLAPTVHSLGTCVLSISMCQHWSRVCGSGGEQCGLYPEWLKGMRKCH